jgi:hypothetical protein
LFFNLSPSPLDIVYGKQKEEALLQGEEKKERTYMDKIKKIHIRV